MQIEKINIKKFAKNLASCVKTYGVENISHSAALNMASRILGIKDYNTFKSMEREITVINKDEEKDKKGPDFMEGFDFPATYSFKNAMKEYDKEMADKYPEYDNEMVPFSTIGDTAKSYIAREYTSIDTYAYYLSFVLNKSITNRVYYSPIYSTISFYVYPDIKQGIVDYHIRLLITEDQLSNKTNILEVLRHVSGKVWFNMEFLFDYMNLCEYLEKNIGSLNEFRKKYPRKKLESLYLFHKQKKHNG